MDDSTEVVVVNSSQTLKFFMDQVERKAVKGAMPTEILYVASILAHFAEASRGSDGSMAPPINLYEILDNFILRGLHAERARFVDNPDILEIAGSQTLFLTGFFRDQMRTRHNVGWYEEAGQGFFERASDKLPWGEKAAVLRQVAWHFSLWAVACSKISKSLRERRYLLRLV